MIASLTKTTTAIETKPDLDSNLDPDTNLEPDLEIVTELDISHLTLEDDTPVDNFQSEGQQRILVEPLYSAKVLAGPFLAAANVGLFYLLDGDPIVPDAMLSLGVQRPTDYSKRQNRSYFVWQFGKVPDVCIEIVSNQKGGELTLWEGLFEEDIPRLWLRWCDEQGQVIPTGAEGQEQERQRAEQAEQQIEQERQRADRLAELLRQQGIDPNALP